MGQAKAKTIAAEEVEKVSRALSYDGPQITIPLWNLPQWVLHSVCGPSNWSEE